MQYIHWNKRPYIHGGAVKRQDIFIWFITLFHLIHEQLASGDRRERGRLVLSSLTLYSVARRGNRKRERDKHWREMYSPWEPLISKSISWTQQRYTSVVSYIDHSPHNMQEERRGITFKWSRDGVLSRLVLYDQLYIMLIPAWWIAIEKNCLEALDGAWSK